MIYVLAMFFSVMASASAQAACSCQCVNGNMQPICSSAMDLPPICPPKICGIVPPSVAPINPLRVPPIGTSNCYQAQVQNQWTGQYQWKQICR